MTPERIRRVLVLGDESKGDVADVLPRVRTILEPRGALVDVLLRRDAPIEVEVDLLVVLGGDGSILSAARRMGTKQRPTLGINLGKLGFLAEVGQDQLESALTAAMEGELEEETRMLLECQPVEGMATIHVLNDVVIQRGDARRMVEVDVFVGGRFVTSYVGDGVILATPVGSTAYSLSAGGPVVAPDVEALVLTPLAAHALPLRPLVVRSDREIELQISGGTGKLTFDGQVDFEVEKGDRIRIRRSRERFRLLTPEPGDFFDILCQKFGWAGSPRYSDVPKGNPAQQSRID
ncbi:MAG: NAD(+)/NADH kinase [Planctomycetes bacterium]|nr:NAD(+)/NADH kinase [Planctomycetota bacterium]